MEQCEWQNDDRNVIIESIMTLKDSLSQTNAIVSNLANVVNSVFIPSVKMSSYSLNFEGWLFYKNKPVTYA